ncbi:MULTISPECIES: alpha/beta hydrolase [Rheinheimera]|uniref:Alpha/beta hydrolase n=1 Tax=Rheinheimera marina TaxID=1774958 RepID=A0ABV9JHP2_9GAMM
MKLWCAMLLVLGLQAQAEQPAFAEVPLPDTQVIELPDPSSGRQYQLWLDLPASYQQDKDKRFAVLVLTDANYAFPLVRSINNRLGAGGQNIEDFILVGLSYAKQDNATDSRSLDYTPTNVRAKAKPESRYGAKAYGGAPAYQQYLKTQVLPYLSQHYRVDPKRLIFVGHSFGALLGSQILLTEPQLFSHYVLSSPSLWFDQHWVWQQEKRYAQSHQDLPATVLLYAGAYEQQGPTARHYKTNTLNMVADMQKFAALLQSHQYPSLQLRQQVIADEDHLSVFPRMISDALLQLLPGTGPYTPG